VPPTFFVFVSTRDACGCAVCFRAEQRNGITERVRRIRPRTESTRFLRPDRGVIDAENPATKTYLSPPTSSRIPRDRIKRPPPLQILCFRRVRTLLKRSRRRIVSTTLHHAYTFYTVLSRASIVPPRVCVPRNST